MTSDMGENNHFSALGATFRTTHKETASAVPHSRGLTTPQNAAAANLEDPAKKARAKSVTTTSAVAFMRDNLT